MSEIEGVWVSLFSGGKDSSWALYRALEEGLDVRRLVTVHPAGDSYMYHVPATDLATLAAESVGIDLVDVEPDDFEAESVTDSSVQGDNELEPLEAALQELDDELEGGIAGVTAGAVESEYQTTRIEGLCDRLGCDLFAPLWEEKPRELADAMLEAGFEISIIQVAAHGLDESWLGRTLDRETLAELEELNEEYGVHILGEGGEFETLVVDGPHMDRRIELDYVTEWEGTRGQLRITDAGLE
ncbi:diphthine--ammonia ligase [Natronobacterium gregoryi]|uniref:ATP-binding protein n=2 Tax=Natronobacterium gregoryi TaxID=44930 RepID=L0AFR8_NATGS|nr:diphthine--ammonia ligase [Natronobacterium gregoryi]AFZ71905.1 metal-binding-domain/4Fe-4S-binding-domain containing ABC transporter, ATP-binding protein [Natronobacterium gregoryi SP2]ELY62474.1 universal metal-binding-domain/4Fe-4S-binding-domain containing ABC transporter protein [Natronobacterium gregoryi SP2]PLK20689.1 ATP-binding protein [Natronobacterium gregoryi SP2]SFJ14310.1 metal-binding-domain/4Fe-4S-binding-domain containing ABC transporter, ATP-binding protein [Natronobacteriu